MKHEAVKRLTVLSMLSALAFVVVAVARIPIMPIDFLKYEPKDVIIAIGGFLYGPMAALLITTVVSVIEMLTISSTGWIGLLMNILSSAGFACTAALIYRKKHTLRGAIFGLLSGVLVMTGLMLLWNYLITPLYMGTPRAEVANMLIPIFLPFNLLKGSLNAALTFLIFRPVLQLLRKTGLFPKKETAAGTKHFVWIGAVAVLITCVLLILVMNGIL